MDIWGAVKGITHILDGQVLRKTGPRLCESCFRLWIQMAIGDFEEDSLGTSNAIFERRNCALCCLIYSVLLAYTKDPKSVGDNGQGTQERVQAWTGESEIWLADNNAQGKRKLDIILVRKGGSMWIGEVCVVQNAASYPALIYPLKSNEIKAVRRREVTQVHGGEVVDTEQIQIWISECRTKHGPACNAKDVWPIRQGNNIDLNLIDVEDMCIVAGNSDHTYLTLSYTWGKSPATQTFKDISEHFMSKGGLKRFWNELPLVVCDAIILTVKLGFRYLWVDILCIAQDNWEEKLKMIQLMDIVYTRAFLTIVAVGSEDSSYPLTGVRPGTRAPFKHVGWANGEYFVAGPPTLSSALEDSTYRTRAWTFQEQLVSRRCLYFTKYQVYFHCVETFWEENIKQGAFERDFGHISSLNRIFINPLMLYLSRCRINPGLAPSPNAVLTAYTKLVERYTARKLSDPGDILHAFAGLSAILEQLCGTGEIGTSLFGLLPSMLDLCLLWYPKSPPKRRLIESKVPSWSWAGWEGDVQYLDISDFGFVERDGGSKFQPLTYWADPNISEYNQGKEQMKELRSEIIEYVLLKDGQSRIIWRQPVQRMQFLDTSLRSHKKETSGTPSAPKSELPLLSFSTVAASIDQVRIVVLKRSTKMSPDYCTAMYSPSGDEIGMLYGFEEFEGICPKGDECDECHYVHVDRMHNRMEGRTEKWDYSEFMGPGRHLSPFLHVCLDQDARGPCELILLSSRLGECPFIGFGKNTAMVMLIRWVTASMAERITIGEVKRHAWDRMVKKEKAILLS